jgi:hypothetical protein
MWKIVIIELYGHQFQKIVDENKSDNELIDDFLEQAKQVVKIKSKKNVKEK